MALARRLARGAALALRLSAMQQQQRMLQGVVAALGHPFSRLRTDAIAQLQKLGLDVSRIADRVVSALTDTQTTEPWFRLQALMESLVELLELCVFLLRLVRLEANSLRDFRPILAGGFEDVLDLSELRRAALQPGVPKLMR